jgi:hypothetical protein
LYPYLWKAAVPFLFLANHHPKKMKKAVKEKGSSIALSEVIYFFMDVMSRIPGINIVVLI